MLIKDIDLILFKNSILYRYDNFITNRYFSEKEIFIQKCKVFLLGFNIIIQIIKYLIYLMASNNGLLPIYYLDILQFIGGISEMAYLAFIFLLIFILSYIYIMNNGSNYEWYKILQTLSGLKPFYEIGLNEKNMILNFITRISLIKTVINIFIKLIYLFAFIYTITVLYINMNASDILYYGILTGILYLNNISIIIANISYSFFYYFIICYYSRLRLIDFKERLIEELKIKLFIKNMDFNELIREHNSICKELIIFNQFWCRYNFIVCYTLIPLLLLVTHLTLFQRIHFTALLIIGTFNIFMVFAILLTNLMTASINSEISNSYQFFHKLIVHFEQFMQIKSKFKVFQVYSYYKSL